MKKRSLLFKVIMINSFIVVIIMHIIVLLAFIGVKSDFFNEKRQNFEKAGIYLSQNISEAYMNSDKKHMQTALDIAKATINSDIILFDKSMNTVMTTQGCGNEYKNIKITEKNIDTLKSNTNTEYMNKNYYASLYPVFDKNSEFEGAILMYYPLSSINRRLSKIYIIIWAIAILAILVLVLALSFLLQNVLLNPLAEINNAAKKFANGEVEKRVKIRSNDEIGELAESFNSMAESLEKVEMTRREFISNVSHELRSPITSIKGFIAGILDGVIPKEREREYLQRTYDETSRIARLINELLDLSAISSGKLKFYMDKTDINEIVKRCIINDEAKIKRKGIDVKLDTCKDKCYVKTDRDKIMQVVTNLLDNAIKYCNDKGIIQIRIYPENHKILVEFYNNGPQLTEEEQKHIWDRFYKSDKSRTNKVSTGLGLPIVRMMLSEMGEEVWAENDKNEGVRFIFTLAKFKE